MRWAEPYCSIPFKLYGRAEDGVDCWGMVRLVYAKELGIDLPSYGSISADQLIRAARQIRRQQVALEDWACVSEPMEFDVVAMSATIGHARYATHVGIYLGRGKILHTELGRNTCVVDVGHSSVANRILGYYRHASRQ